MYFLEAKQRQGDEVPVLGDLLLAPVPLSGVALQGPLQLESVKHDADLVWESLCFWK